MNDSTSSSFISSAAASSAWSRRFALLPYSLSRVPVIFPESSSLRSQQDFTTFSHCSGSFLPTALL
ncbi:hypothetical protein HMPREF1006_00762 [Synergistes sp. 3_1_syn1]|nr:hypothetical protein HMPREF1006_00762 [Synergistes sp. 3_1_syn1]